MKEKWYENVGWRHVHIEGMCIYNIAKDKKMKLADSKEILKATQEGRKVKWKKINNCNYINPKLRVKSCRKTIGYNCLASKCPFFAYTNNYTDDYIVFENAYDSKLIRFIAKIRHWYRKTIKKKVIDK